MDKDSAAEPETKQKIKPAASKKKATPKKKTAKKATKRTTSSQARASTAKTATAAKTDGARKKSTTGKRRAPSRAAGRPKAAERKPKPASQRKRASKMAAPAIRQSRNKDSGDTAHSQTTPLGRATPESQPKDILPPQRSAEKIYPATDAHETPDPFKKFLRWVFVGFVVLIATMIFISYQNLNKYFITARHGAVEIWKGKFSPKSRKRILIMPGIQPPQQIKEVYTKEEVFPMAFHFYIGKADALMEVPGLPDFVGIKSYLNRALSYATTDALRHTAKTRINSIDLMILLYKADAAASKGTVANLESAIKYLDQASKLGPDEIEAKLIKQKLESIQKLKEILSPKPKKTETVEETPENQSLQKKPEK